MKTQKAFAGQIGIFTLLAIVIIALVAVITAFQLGVFHEEPFPPAVGEKEKLVRAYVENIIRENAKTTIEWMENHGGYIIPPPLHVMFEGHMVPYYQQCSNTLIPDKTNIIHDMENSVKNFLKYNLNTATKINGRLVYFDLESIRVTALMYANKIEFLVHLPTTVEGYSINQPYKVTIPTKFADIYDFARGFSEKAARERFFETYTINTILHSRELPTIGFMNECGEKIDLSSEDIKRGYYNVVRHVLTNIKFWSKEVPEGARYFPLDSVNVNGEERTYPLSLIHI